MNSLKKLLITGVCFGMIALTGACRKIDRPTPTSWSPSIKIQQDTLTEERIVSDSEAGTGLFTHNEYSTAQPISVRKVEPDRWITVFEKSRDRDVSDVQIERISDSEYRIVITTPSAE